MAIQQKITPLLWFDDNAEEAVSFYVSLFRDSRIVTRSRYGESGGPAHDEEDRHPDSGGRLRRRVSPGLVSGISVATTNRPSRATAASARKALR